MAGENEVAGGEQPAGSLPESGSGAKRLTTTDAAAELAKLGEEPEAKAEGESNDGAQADEKPEDAEEATEGEADEAEPDDEESEEKGEDEDEGEAQDDESEDEKSTKRVPYERLAKEVGKRHEAEERATAAEERAAQLENQAAAQIGLHPAYLSKAEADVISRAESVERREEFLFKNLDGFENSPDAKALGLPESLTATQVKEKYVEARREAGRVVPQATSIYEQRRKLMLEDLERGRALRLAKKPAKTNGNGKGDVAKAKEQRPKSVLPSGAGGSSRPVTQPTATRGMNLDRFKKRGASREAALAELAEL